MISINLRHNKSLQPTRDGGSAFMKSAIITFLSGFLLFGCASDTRMHLAEGDVLTVVETNKNRCEVEWTREKVTSSDGMPRYEFRRDIWIENSQITDLGIDNISKGDNYRLVNSKLIQMTIVEFRGNVLVPAKQKPN